MIGSNPNWGRWSFASISQHFKDLVVDPYSLAMFVEGQHRETDIESNWFELRVDGPFTKSTQKNQWQLIVEINCLVSTGMDDQNYHKHRLNADRVAAAFTTCIRIYRYGKESGDDDSYLGSYYLRAPDDVIDQTHFGQLEPQTKMQQATVEGHYRMELSV